MTKDYEWMPEHEAVEIIAWLRSVVNPAAVPMIDAVLDMEEAIDNESCGHTAREIEVGGIEAGSGRPHSPSGPFGDALRTFAAIYDSLPGYREEWRPASLRVQP